MTPHFGNEVEQVRILASVRGSRAAGTVFLLAAVVSGGAAIGAGVREDAIGIDFPERLGEFALKGRTQFPQAADGATIAYESKDVRGAVYVYTGGIASIPTGVGDPVIHRHFQQTVAALQQAARESSTTLKQVRGSTISRFDGCGPQFMWRADEISMGGNAMVSRTYLAGFKNHFVKLRVTHARGNDSQPEDFVHRMRRILGSCG
jgi:hypothetical protein